MEKKNEQGNKKINDNKPIVVKVNAKKIVAKPKVEIIDTTETQRTLEEHMKENMETNKKKVDVKDILVYAIVIIIVALCIFLLYNFFVKTGKNLFANETTTTTRNRYATTTATTTKKVGYQTTTEIPTKATHTIYVNTTKRGEGKTYTTTKRSTTKPTTTTTRKVVENTTTTTTTTTSVTTTEAVENN